MSFFSDLLSFGGSYLGDKEQANANNKLAQVQQNAQDWQKGSIESGQVDAFGNIISRRDPTTGAYTTTLSGPSQQLANQQLSNSNTAEANRGQYGDIATDLAGQFKGTQIQKPLTRPDAQMMVDKDNKRVFDSVINPISDKIALQTQRTMGNTTNAPNYALQATQQILPAIQLGGEQKAYALSNDDMDRFIRQTLSLSENANNAAGASNIQLPGVASQGQIANSLNAVQTPSTVPIDSNSAFYNSVAQLGNQINARESQSAANSQSERLIALLERQLGNQG